MIRFYSKYIRGYEKFGGFSLGMAAGLRNNGGISAVSRHEVESSGKLNSSTKIH